jgi:hypothetical protein
MPSVHQIKLPQPSDWQEFQRMICDLYKRIWGNEFIQEFGTIGQRQNGVDIFGYPNFQKHLEGIQCKCVKKLTKTEIEIEYKKSLQFLPKLSHFIIVTTTKRDRHIQQKAAEITAVQDYPCDVVFWEDVCQQLSDHSDLLRKYYSDFFIKITVFNSHSKLIKIEIDINHYEILISKIKSGDNYYNGTILVSDLLSRRCITYRLGDHWSRLDGIVGLTKCDAFLISKWLNSYKNIDTLLRLKETKVFYQPNFNDKKEAKKLGFSIG